MSARREIHQIIKRLEAEFGCTVRTNGTGHYRVSRPGYSTVTVSKTPNDWHAIGNIKSDLKRYLGITL